MEARRALEELGLHGRIPVIADGGVRGPGDVAKALIAGASVAMSGRLFAGCEEAESPKVVIGDRVYKQYRGMASRGAIEKRFASDRYSKPSKHIVEGVEGLVPYTGSVYEALAGLVAGIKAALGYAGARTIEEAWRARLAKITPSAAREARPHDLVL
jgi:IMP dehydrogenase